MLLYAGNREQIHYKMSENHEIVRIFLASPSGLDEERTAIREIIEDINRRNSSHWLLRFEAVGWEDTVGGNRRAQEIINRDLEKCDYFFGILDDHWGTPPSPNENVETKYTSGFEEEYELANKMYENKQMADIFLFFKKIQKLRDPGPSLRKVLEFQQHVKDSRKPLYVEFEKIDVFKNKIYDALNKIGWERKTSNPGGTVSALSDQNSDVFDSVSELHPETSEFYLSEPTREFLNAIKNKSGKSDALTKFEVARLRLISSGLHQTGNDGVYIGAHDANLLFFFRTNLELSHMEKTTLLTAGLRHMEYQTVPFWCWTDGNLERTEQFIQSRLVANDDSVASSALKIADIFGYRHPSDPENINRVVCIMRWLNDQSNSSLRNIAETYLSRWAQEDDIPVLQHVRELRSGQQATNLDCIIVSIKFRHSESAGFRELKERDPEQISTELQLILQDTIQGQTSEVLEGLAKQKSDYLRLASIRELIRRNALSEEMAEELSGDNSVDIRLEAIKSLSDRGVRISESRAQRALVINRNDPGLAIFSDSWERKDTSKFEDYRRHKLSRMSLMELLAMDEKNSPLDADALLTACRIFPKETRILLRELIKDGFEERFENRLADTLYSSTSKGEELAERTRKLKNITCLQQTQEALIILVTQMKQKDLGLVREVVDRQEIEPSKQLFQYFARFGNWNDIERILKTRSEEGKGVTFTSFNYFYYVVDLTDALVKIGSSRFVDLLERIEMPELRPGVIKSVGNQVFKQLSDEKLLELLSMEGPEFRKITALKCINVLPKSRVSSLLEKYMEKKSRFYNVIHWLDLGSSMPRHYVQKIARTELEKL